MEGLVRETGGRLLSSGRKELAEDTGVQPFPQGVQGQRTQNQMKPTCGEKRRVSQGSGSPAPQSQAISLGCQPLNLH